MTTDQRAAVRTFKRPSFWRRHRFFKRFFILAVIVAAVLGLLKIPGRYYPSFLQTHPEIRPPAGSEVTFIYRDNLWERVENPLTWQHVFVRFECIVDGNDQFESMLAEFEKPLLAGGWTKTTLTARQWLLDFLARNPGFSPADLQAMQDVAPHVSDIREIASLTLNDFRKYATTEPSADLVQNWELRWPVSYRQLSSNHPAILWDRTLKYILIHNNLQIAVYSNGSPAANVEGDMCYALTFVDGGKSKLVVVASHWFNK